MGQGGGTGSNLLGERVQLGAQGGAFGVAGIKLGLGGGGLPLGGGHGGGDGIQQDLVLLLLAGQAEDLVLLLAKLPAGRLAFKGGFLRGADRFAELAV